MVSIMRRPACVRIASMVIAGLIQAESAKGAEWTLAADVAERVEADSNFRLEENPDGPVAGSTSRVGVNLTAETKRTRWTLRSGVGIAAFTGSAATNELDSVNPGVDGSVRYLGKRFSARGVVNFRRTPVAFTQFGLEPLPEGSLILPGGTVQLPDETVAALEDFETITREDATRTQIRARGIGTLLLDQVNRVSLSAATSVRRFSGNSGELVDTTSYGLGTAWERDVGKRTTADLALGVQRTSADNDANTEVLSYTATGGLGAQLTPGLKVGLDAGLTVFDIAQDPPENDETAVNFAGELRLDWGLTDTNLSLLLSHRADPSSLGDVQRTSAVVLGIGHAINARSVFSIATSYARQASIGGATTDDERRQLFVVSPTYTIDLTSAWRLEMGYTFRLGAGDDGSATSHNVFVEVSRSFDLLR